MVEVQESPESPSTPDVAVAAADVVVTIGEGDDVADALVISLSLMMGDVVVEGAEQRVRAEEDQAVQGFLFGSANPPLGDSIGVSRQLHPMRTIG